MFQSTGLLPFSSDFHYVFLANFSGLMTPIFGRPYGHFSFLMFLPVFGECMPTPALTTADALRAF